MWPMHCVSASRLLDPSYRPIHVNSEGSVQFRPQILVIFQQFPSYKPLPKLDRPRPCYIKCMKSIYK